LEAAAPFAAVERGAPGLLEERGVPSEFARERAAEDLEGGDAVETLRAHAPVDHLALEILDDDRLLVAEEEFDLFAGVALGAFVNRVVAHRAVEGAWLAGILRGIDHYMPCGAVLAAQAGLLGDDFSKESDPFF
jgi:hypothetical protein